MCIVNICDNCVVCSECTVLYMLKSDISESFIPSLFGAVHVHIADTMLILHQDVK